MNYSEQIESGSIDNIRMLLGEKNKSLDNITKKALFKRNVEIVSLELSYQCNRKCDYCPVRTSDRQSNQLFMPVSNIKKIVSDLKSIRYSNIITLNLYNEPLLDDELHEKVRIIRSALPLCYIMFNSNGDELNRTVLDSLHQAGVNFINVTLHPSPGVEHNLSQMKYRLDKILSRVCNDNDNIDYLVNSDIGVEVMIRGLRLRVQWPDWRSNGTTRASLLDDHKAYLLTRTSPCMKPFREFTIFYDGIVQPCCEAFHDSNTNLHPLGDTRISSIFDIYTSMNTSLFRREVYSFSPKTGMCKHCNSVDYIDVSDAERRNSLLLSITQGE